MAVYNHITIAERRQQAARQAVVGVVRFARLLHQGLFFWHPRAAGVTVSVATVAAFSVLIGNGQVEVNTSGPPRGPRVARFHTGSNQGSRFSTRRCLPDNRTRGDQDNLLTALPSRSLITLQLKRPGDRSKGRQLGCRSRESSTGYCHPSPRRCRIYATVRSAATAADHRWQHDNRASRQPLAILVMFAISSLIVFAALKMKRLQAYWLAVAAAFWAIIISPGNLIGLPIGIWALVVLSQREVRMAFAGSIGSEPEERRHPLPIEKSGQRICLRRRCC